MRYFRSWCAALYLCAVIAGVNSLAWSQEATSSLRGTVTDQSGGVIVAANVTLTNVGTNGLRKTTTDRFGDYLFPRVEVGTYKLTIEHSGFKTYVQTGIVLEVNQNGRVDVSMKLGESTQTVEVTANAPQVDTTGAVLGSVENLRRLQDLPILDRESGTLSLALLQAGVFAPDPDESDATHNPFSVSGQRSESLTFYVDGADNTDFLSNRIVQNPISDAVQEFRILTNNYDAQYGRTSGGIVNQVIKSGANSFHGDLFEFWRNDVLNARNFFLLNRENFKRNLFGGSAGGPIKKGKVFFFGSYQGSRRREGQLAPILQVLSPAERTGDFRELCSSYDINGNCTDPNGTQLVNPITGANYAFNKLQPNSVIGNYINKYLPLPNIPGTNNFVSSPTGRIRDDQFAIKSDANLSSRDTLSFFYLFEDQNQLLPLQIVNGASTGGNVPVGSGTQDLARRQVGGLTWTHTFANQWINQARFAANRRAELQAKPLDTTPPKALGFLNVNPDDPGGAAPPIIFTNSFNLGPSPQGPTKEHDATFQWTDDVSVTRGRHEIKFGGDVRRVRNNFVFDFFNNGSLDFTFGNFTGNELADFVGGFPDNFFQFSKAIYGIRESSYFVYGMDTWKILPRLTLNFGLRYEYNSPQTDPHKEIMGFFPGRQSTVFPNAPPDILYAGDPNTGGPGLVYPDRNNFAPRFGFAWDILGNSKLIMRGGGGIFYDIEDGALNLQFGGQPPFGDAVSTSPSAMNFQNGIDPVKDPFGSVGIVNPFPFQTVGTFFIPKISFAYLVDPHFRTPYSENYNFGFQYQMTKDTMVEAEYVGSLGRKLISSAEVNFPVPSVMMQQLAQFGAINADCARPLAACTGGSSPIDPAGSATGATALITNLSNGLSDSHQLQVTVDKRFSRGFQFRAAYTFGKTIDTLSGFRARSSGFTDPLNYRLDRGLADFDTPQRLVISGFWEIPWDRPFRDKGGFLKKVTEGWQLNVISEFQGGTPITLFANSNASEQHQVSTFGDLTRPDIVGPVHIMNPRSVHTFTSDCLGGTVTGNFWIDPTNLVCSACPLTDPTCSQAGDIGIPLFSFGTLGRNVFRGPGINNWDMSIIKRTKITESKSIEFRAEFFNAFNHTQFVFPVKPSAQGGTTNFGQTTRTRDPRVGQLALKFIF